MNAPDASHTGLANALARELSELRTFQSLLGRECDAAIAGDSDRLEAVAAEKSRQLVQLAALFAEREKWMREASISGAIALAATTNEGHADGDSSAAQLLARVKAAWVAARATTEATEAVLHLRMLRTKRSLAVLRQVSGQTDCYRPDGQLGGHYLTA